MLVLLLLWLRCLLHAASCAIPAAGITTPARRDPPAKSYTHSSNTAASTLQRCSPFAACNKYGPLPATCAAPAHQSPYKVVRRAPLEKCCSGSAATLRSPPLHSQRR
mmetsp:Transcript_5386/g.15424  ORF Transcript_5386/g.15424 Transcript_5386/m.15424 type:complete len:107 (+) Transcript_5386:2606-2926(+)